MRLYDAGYFDARAEVVKLLDFLLSAAPSDDHTCYIDVSHLRERVLNLQPTLHVSPTPDLPQYVRNHDD